MSGTTGRPEHDPGIRKALLDFALANVAKVSLVEVTANLYAAIADWHRREMASLEAEVAEARAVADQLCEPCDMGHRHHLADVMEKHVFRAGITEGRSQRV